MPNPLEAANAVVTLPYSLAIAFQSSSTYLVDQNFYHNGESQAVSLAETPRRRWVQTKRLKPALLAQLRQFFLDVKGGWSEFWFYDLYETDPIFSYDNSGGNPIGRYAVTFEGGYSQVLDIGRSQAGPLALVEVD